MVTTVTEGSLTFNPDGTYSFDPGNDFEDLAAGATRAVTFTYTATDNSGAVSEPKAVTITVTGADDNFGGDTNTSEGGDEVPEVDDEALDVGDEIPDVDDEIPDVDDEVLEVGDEVPTVGDEVPEVNEDTFEVDDVISAGEDITQAVESVVSLPSANIFSNNIINLLQPSNIELLPLDYEPVLLDVLDGISDLLGQANLSTAQPNLNLISEFNVIEDLIQSEANRIDTQDFAQSESLVDEEFLLLDEPDTENSTTLNQENLDEDLIASLQTSERFSSQLSKILDSNQAELEVLKKMLS
ncbi:MAG: VCBS domain-containing protein, partial [Pseudomonadota bacterium]|nr:VCBS domain-containing protein [Pseudomonadota bacterium]